MCWPEDYSCTSTLHQQRPKSSHHLAYWRNLQESCTMHQLPVEFWLFPLMCMSHVPIQMHCCWEENWLASVEAHIKYGSKHLWNSRDIDKFEAVVIDFAADDQGGYHHLLFRCVAWLINQTCHMLSPSITVMICQISQQPVGSCSNHLRKISQLYHWDPALGKRRRMKSPIYSKHRQAHSL